LVIQFGLFTALLAGCAAHANSPSANEGRTLYEANGCARCHGQDGGGDGPSAPTLASKPTNLHDPSLFKNGASEDAIAETLAKGVLIVHSTPELHQTHHEYLMPQFAHLTGRERRSIALYVLSLSGSANHARTQP
jgi:mono/diheme cytochrome c family protein